MEGFGEEKGGDGGRPDGAWAWGRGGGSREAGVLCGSLGDIVCFLWLVPSWKWGQKLRPL